MAEEEDELPPLMKQNGGVRKGAGRKKGGHNKKTLEKMAVQNEFKQRIMQHVDSLFNAHLALALGSIQVFRKDRIKGQNGHYRDTHTLVTESDEIKKVLDEHNGKSGKVGETFYFVTEVGPNERAIDTMINRVFGRPEISADVEDTMKTARAIRAFDLWASKNPLATDQDKVDAIKTIAEGSQMNNHELAKKVGVQYFDTTQ